MASGRSGSWATSRGDHPDHDRLDDGGMPDRSSSMPFQAEPGTNRVGAVFRKLTTRYSYDGHDPRGRGAQGLTAGTATIASRLAAEPPLVNSPPAVSG